MVNSILNFAFSFVLPLDIFFVDVGRAKKSGGTTCQHKD
jgi:hypothetical protein